MASLPRRRPSDPPAALHDERRYLPALLLVFGTANVSAYARDAVIAAVFGASARTDAYFIATFLPTLLATILVFESAIPALVPLLSRAAGDAGSTRRLLIACLIPALVILAAVFVLAWSASLPMVHLLARGWGPTETHLSASLLRITAACLPPLGLAAILGAVLNVRHRYAAPPLGMTAMNLTVIAATLTLHGRLGIYAPAWGMVAGSVVCLLWQCWGVARLDLRPSAPGAPVSLEMVGRAMLPMLLFSTLAQHVTIVERWLASALPGGQISYLVYAGKLMMSPLLVITGAGSLLAFVAMSRAGVDGDGAAFRAALTRSARLLTILLGMATVALVTLRRPIVELALEHGHFTTHDAGVTSMLLAVYALGLVPNGLSWLLYRSLQSRERYWEAVRIAAVAATLYVGCALALFQIWRLAGIAAAFPVSQTAACVLLYRFQPRSLRVAPGDVLRFAWPLALLCAVVASLVLALDAGISALAIGPTQRYILELLCAGAIIMGALSLGMPLLRVPEGRLMRGYLAAAIGRATRWSAISGE